MPDSPADAAINDADLQPADRLRIRLWLALIDAFVENAHIAVAWQISNAIDTQWKAHSERMYAEGYADGVQAERERQDAEATARQQLANIEQRLLDDQPATLY